MTPRLLVATATAGAAVALDQRQSHYLCAVLRLRAGAEIEIFDGRGQRYRTRLAISARSGCVTEALVAIAGPAPSPLVLTLAQCLPAGDKMDWIVEKAVELGVHEIITLSSQRIAQRGDAARGARRLAHWQRIAEAACMQCGRDRIPAVRAPQSLAEWLARQHGDGAQEARLALLPGAASRLSRVALAPGAPVALLVGPEAGFSDEELGAIAAAGFVPVSLGPRVLRTETAGLAALAALQALHGDS